MNTIQLIYRVLSGKASEEDILLLEQWKTSSAENKAEYDDIKILWECSREHGGGGDLSEKEYREGWQQIKRRMVAIHRRRKRTRVMFVVVIIALSLGVVAWFAYHKGKQDRPSLHGTMEVGRSNV